MEDKLKQLMITKKELAAGGDITQKGSKHFGEKQSMINVRY